MPVIKPRQLRDNPELMPQFSSFGIFVRRRGENTERHYHDCDEWWIITAGHALIAGEGYEAEVERGDMVYTPRGQQHEIVEVYRDLEGVYIEGPLHGERRRGHLHREDED